MYQTPTLLRSRGRGLTRLSSLKRTDCGRAQPRKQTWMRESGKTEVSKQFVVQMFRGRGRSGLALVRQGTAPQPPSLEPVSQTRGRSWARCRQGVFRAKHAASMPWPFLLLELLSAEHRWDPAVAAVCALFNVFSFSSSDSLLPEFLSNLKSNRFRVLLSWRG